MSCKVCNVFYGKVYVSLTTPTFKPKAFASNIIDRHVLKMSYPINVPSKVILDNFAIKLGKAKESFAAGHPVIDACYNMAVT